MNWKRFRNFLWVDTRFKFLNVIPKGVTLLDIGSSDGHTLTHFNEARPDIHYFATDIEGKPESYPSQAHFFRADITKDRLPWSEHSMDGITSMHLVEHIGCFDNFFSECARLLRTNGKLYIETPHPKTLTLSMPYRKQAGKFTYNFWDDLTHVQIVPLGKIAPLAFKHGFHVKKLGTSRNLFFVISYPFSFLFNYRKRLISRVHFYWF
jgi:SAM-dependent methyltransferase